MVLGARQGSSPAPGYGSYAQQGVAVYDPALNTAVQYLNSIAAFSEFGPRFPFNKATTTSLTTTGGEELTSSINRYDNLTVNKPLKVSINPCLIFARKITLAANPLLSAGPNSAGTGAAATALGGNNAWSNPGNVTASDDVRATADLSTAGDVTHYLKATNFGFSIPTSAVIEGIKVEIEKSLTNAGPTVVDRAVKIIKGGTVGGANLGDQSTGWGTTTDFYSTYGGNANRWGETWTPADINASTFGVAFAAHRPAGSTALTARVDHVRITVYYYDGGMIYADGAGRAGGAGATGARPNGSKVNATAAGVGLGFAGQATLSTGGDTSGLSSGASGAGGTASGAGGDATAGGNGGASDDANAGATGGAVGASGAAATRTIEMETFMLLGRWTKWLYRFALGPAASAGGGGGGGSASTTNGRNGGNGGDGGGSGGQLWIFCEQWDNGGLVRSRGRSGKAGQDSQVTNASDGCGGPGGGGNGGAIKVIALSSLTDGTFNVDGGAAGPASSVGATATLTGVGGAGVAGIYDMDKVT